MDFQQFDQLVAICEPLSDKLIQIQQRGFNVETKDDDSPVTDADLLAHKTLCEHLPQVTDIAIVSEEDIPDDKENLTSYWLIDPIDGTKEFVEGTDQFTIHIARITDNKPDLGFVYVPGQHIAYAATPGNGAYKWDGQEWNQIYANERTEQLISVESRLHKSPQDEIVRAQFDIADYIEMGSSLKILAIAEGSADLYVRTLPTKVWDTVPPQLILQEAGGEIFDMDNNPLRCSLLYMTNPHFIAVNKGLKKDLSTQSS